MGKGKVVPEPGAASLLIRQGVLCGPPIRARGQHWCGTEDGQSESGYQLAGTGWRREVQIEQGGAKGKEEDQGDSENSRGRRWTYEWGNLAALST